MTEPSWDLWRAFVAVIESGTLSGAARRLSVTQPTIGRQVEALEDALGYALFVRSQQGLAPTEAALALAPLAATMAATASALARTSVGAADGGAGRVRLTASEVVACEVLPPIISTFRAAHPHIDIELSANNEIEDLLTREADLAVRMRRPTQQALIAKKIGDVKIGLFARADYLARMGVPATLDDLQGHTLIGYDKQVALLDYLASLGADPPRQIFNIRTDNELAQIALLRAGVGIGGMQRPMARHSPELQPLLHSAFSIPMEIWLVMHEDLQRAQHIRLLFDHLENGLNAYLKQ
jgi:DNA-binding transcriptional LysR family regulator